MSNFNPGDSSVSNELGPSLLHQSMVINENKNPLSRFFLALYTTWGCVCVCDHTPSPPQRCPSSLLAVAFSSQQAWPGSPPSSPPGFCLEFRLCARGSCSPRQPSTGGLDARTHRKRNESDSNLVFKLNIFGFMQYHNIPSENWEKYYLSLLFHCQFILKPTEAAKKKHLHIVEYITYT